MGPGFRLLLLLTVLVCSPLIRANAQPVSQFVRKEAGNQSIIVFVHGVLGDSKSTWDNNGVFWPNLLKGDPAFDGSDIFVYGYPTSLWNAMSIDELADNMRLRLTGEGIPEYKQIAFLVHSMGGLVTRSYILKNRDIAERTSLIYFLSTPTSGSQIANIAGLISKNPQFSKMKPMNAEDFLADVLRQWLAADLKIPSYCAYEKRATYGMMIVSFQSASALCTKALDPIDEDHITIAKPLSVGSDAYLAFKAALRRELGMRRPKAALIKQYQEVLQALNSTQLSRSEFLFPQMEEYIRSPTPNKWREIKLTARRLALDVQNVVNATIAFDSQFYQYGDQIVQVANGTREIVDRSFYMTFKKARQSRSSNLVTLDEITEVVDQPTPDQVSMWSMDLKQRYATMESELQKLLKLLIEKS